MERYIINGGKKLEGIVDIDCSKNAVLPMLSACILTSDDVVIENCPKIKDVYSMCDILVKIGVKVKFEDKNLILNAKNVKPKTIKRELTDKLRSSYYVLGSLISRFKYSKISYPGGCKIGKRPIDIHLDSFRKLNVEVLVVNDYITCKTKKVKGNTVILNFPSVGATVNIMLLSSLSEGETVIYNPAKEPEVVDFMYFLNSMGAKIIGAGSDVIVIKGVNKMHGTKYRPIYDRIEAGTFLFLGLISSSKLEIRNVNLQNIYKIVHKFCNNTCKIDKNNGIIYTLGERYNKPFNISTGPFPCFPTDLQPFLTVLAMFCKGKSIVTEKVFENRFNYVYELKKMGGDISLMGNKALICGEKPLHGAHLISQDLRGGAALTVAGISIKGTSFIDGINFIERGYADFENKLLKIGADIKKVTY